MKQDSAKPPAFQGYQIAQANFVQLPTEILWDTKDLAPELHHTLCVAAGKILWEQFRAGVARDTLIPIPLRWWTDTLNLSPNAIRTRLARLEELGRLVIAPNPDPQGGNLYGIRWASKLGKTSFHSHRVSSRIVDLKRLQARVSGNPLQSTEGGEPLQAPEPPPPSGAGTPPPSVDGTPSNKNVQDTDFNNPYQSVRQSSGDVAAQGEEKPTDRRILGLFREEGETLSPQVIEALSLILDPPQVPLVEAQSPFGSKGLWALMESIRIHGKNLGKPAAVLYNAAVKTPGKAQFWILRVFQALEAAGWYAQPSDYTEAATYPRQRILSGLKGLQLIPLDADGQEQHDKLLKEHRQAQLEREAAWRRQLEEPEPLDEQPEEDPEAEDAPQKPQAPPKPVHASDLPPDQAERLLGLIEAYRLASRQASRMTTKPGEDRDALFAASKAAWNAIIAELETIGPRIQAGLYSDVFTPSALTFKNINDLEKELKHD